MDKIVLIGKDGGLESISETFIVKHKVNNPKEVPEVYTFTKLTDAHLESSLDSHRHPYHYKAALHFTKEQQEMIKQVLQGDEMEWVREQSLDGIYVRQVEMPMTFATRFTFCAYLSDADITFWKLKYA